MRARIGHIRFLNCFPILYGLRLSGFLPEDRLVQGTPSQLNRMLVSNELDLAPISSIQYARHAGELLLVPGISISCNGRVMSILLFSKVPIEELSGKRIALTSASATSHVLLRILLERKYRVEAEYLVMDPDLKGMLEKADAALLIGDDAMLCSQAVENRLLVYDLGYEWKDYTGGPMVCAVWAVRRDFARDNFAEAADIQRALVGSVQTSLDRIPEVARAAVNGNGLSAEYLEEYFSTLKFGLTDELKEGLRRYYQEAYEIGALRDIPSLEFLEV